MLVLRADRWIAAIALALGTIACNAIFGETAQCSKDDDCAGFGQGKVCGAEGTCIARSQTPGPASPAGDASTDAAAAADTAPDDAAGPVSTIYVVPSMVSVAAGKTQQFSASGRDKLGGAPSPNPTFTWTVSGGGTISPTGLFTAGAAAGGPFKVTATSGSITGTASFSVTIASITMGETTILATDDSGNADLLLAQKATLPKAATLRSLSFYVATAAGMLRLGIYDATGPDGGPGAKKAETNEIVAAAGWNAIPVVTPVLLPAGDYWLAYAPSDNNLHFERGNDGTGSIAYFSSVYGPMPATFSTTPTNIADRWSFYATLNP
jgi:hypothetical protein